MKKKPPTKEVTRKRKALRRTAILLGMVVFLSAVGAYGFFPTQGWRYNEESYHTGRTHLVQRIYETSLKATRTALFDLTENENVTMLQCIRWHPLVGWADGGAAVVDCGDDVPLYAGHYILSHHGEDGQLLFVFGRVDDLDIESVKISLQYCTYIQAENRESWTEDGSRTSEIGDWKDKDGHRYFVENFGLLKWEDDSGMKIILTTYDKSGQELTSVDISQQGCMTRLG